MTVASIWALAPSTPDRGQGRRCRAWSAGPLLRRLRLGGALVEGGGPLVAWLAALGYTAVTLALAAAFFVRFRGRVAFRV